MSCGLSCDGPLQVGCPDDHHGQSALCPRRHLVLGQCDSLDPVGPVEGLEPHPVIRMLGLEIDLAVRPFDRHRALRPQRVDDRLHDLLRGDARLLERAVRKDYTRGTRRIL